MVRFPRRWVPPPSLSDLNQADDMAQITEGKDVNDTHEVAEK